MQRVFLKISAIALLMNLAAYGQSLGDIARENREKKSEAASAAQPKVITNANLPKDTDANQEPAEAQSEASASGQAADRHSADQRSVQQRLAEPRVADQWKRQILAQENKMANLQARIDELNASIRSAGRSVQYEGPSNRYQARQLRHEAQIQMQLDEQKMKLDQMQEATRHAGMHTTVYDP